MKEDRAVYRLHGCICADNQWLFTKATVRLVMPLRASLLVNAAKNSALLWQTMLCTAGRTAMGSAITNAGQLK